MHLDQAVKPPARIDASPAKVVAFYFYRLAAVGGGAERMVCQLAGAMAKRGFVVQLVTWDAPDASAFYPIEPCVRWVKLGYAPGAADKLRRIRALRDVLREASVQVLVGFVMSGDRTVYAAAKLAGVRLVAAERNSPQMYHLRYTWWQRWLAFRFLGLADRITVQMPSFVGGYPARLQRRVVSIPNPVQLATRRAMPAVADTLGGFTLLAASRLDNDQKRIDLLIAAFGQVAASFPTWQLHIVGDGPAQVALQRLVVDLRLAERVRISPTTLDISSVYAVSHLFVIPSRWEGFPNALAEAMSHGLPAVGFARAAGVAALIGQAGWLAGGLDDATALADAMRQAMSNDQERQQRGELAARSMSHYGAEEQYDRWADLLRELADRETA